MVHRFNLSEWALEHRTLVLYFMIVLAVIGVGSYLRLGQAEDPAFTFKLMVVRTNWPGASADEVERQLTDRIEKKLQETPRLDHLRSYSKPGESVVFVFVKDSSRADEIKDTWYQVRKKVGDIRSQLPAGIPGPFFNDEYGDTFGNIYALTGDGFSYAQLKEAADRIRADLLRVRDVAKVELIGEQDEKIFVEIANAKLATLGVEPAVVFAALAQQNAVASSGSFETATDRLYIRTSGALDSVEYRRHPVFNVDVPATCPDVPDHVLDPRGTWDDGAAYDEQARKLATMFIANFKTFEADVDAAVVAAGPRA